MKRIRHIIPLLVVMGFSSTAWLNGLKLSEIVCSGASVLPFFTEDGVKKVILGREGHGCDRGSFDDFGGGFERSCDRSPLDAAAREFHEEAIMRFSVPSLSTIEKVKEYIDPIKNNTTDFIAFKTRLRGTATTPKYLVTYVVDFSPHAQSLLSNYYPSFNQELKRSEKEKNALAIVAWDDLKAAVTKTPFGEVSVQAQFINKDGAREAKTIRLRRIFSSKMRKFIAGQPSLPSGEAKMSVYSQEKAENVEECVQ